MPVHGPLPHLAHSAGDKAQESNISASNHILRAQVRRARIWPAGQRLAAPGPSGQAAIGYPAYLIQSRPFTVLWKSSVAFRSRSCCRMPQSCRCWLRWAPALCQAISARRTATGWPGQPSVRRGGVAAGESNAKARLVEWGSLALILLKTASLRLTRLDLIAFLGVVAVGLPLG